MLTWAHVQIAVAMRAAWTPAAIAVVAPAAAPESLVDETRREQAAEALAEARELAAAGEYAPAIEAFERALALRPSAGLHYNVAVCHHRLMLSSEPDSDVYETHRRGAVDSYNAYLEGDTDAEDRYAVAGTVTELGGRPKILDEWRVSPQTPSSMAPALRDDATLWPEGTPGDVETPRTDPADDEPVDTDDTEPPVAPQTAPPRTSTPRRVPPPFPRAAFGLAFAADLHGFHDTRGTPQVSTAPVLGPVLWGRAYLGPKRAFGVGGELAWATQPDVGTRQHRLTTAQISATASWRATVGAAGRLDLGVGALLGLVVQTLRHRGPSTAACREQDKGVISSRGGALAALRLQAAFALDPAKRHQLTLRTGPGVGSVSEGVTPKECSLPDAFAEYGLRVRPLLFRTDVGYAFRW